MKYVKTSLLLAALGTTSLAVSPVATANPPGGKGLPGGYKHLVVIYEENHSFDNLYGGWGKVGKDSVDGTQYAPQVTQSGATFKCLPQNDVNLTSPPLASTCADTANGVAASAFAAGRFTIDKNIAPTDTTCPPEGVYAPNGLAKGTGLPGGCTEDIVHRFYQEQYQLNGGKMNRYVTGSDAIGLTQGVYDTKALPIYQYLHSQGSPNYVIADRFFQAAFGGSFLNHQWLISGRTPLDTDLSLGGVNSVLDANGMPTNYPFYKSPSTNVVDKQLTQKCLAGGSDYTKACGDYAVNTIQSTSAPHGGGAAMPLIDDTKFPNIGDRMNADGISWNWYSGGWDAAAAGTPGKNFQFHHQPFNYFANYAVGGPDRSHLQDETKFIAAAKSGALPTVSFVKPYGNENEHPGYASEHVGSDHLVDLLKTIQSGPQANDTLVVVTYDEFGGQADHVAPPKTDAWGPGTRIPALLVAKNMSTSGVNHTTYDTTSIIATIERSYGLAPLGTRDAAVNDLSSAVKTGKPKSNNGNGNGNGNGPKPSAPVTGPPVITDAVSAYASNGTKLLVGGGVVLIGGAAGVGGLGLRRRKQTQD